MIPGFVIVWFGPALPGPSYLSANSEWSKDASEAHVFKTWSSAKTRARAFRGSDVVEAWI